MFINFSNHPNKSWPQKQLIEAKKFGEIIDVPFPNVPASIDDKEILQKIAEESFDLIYRHSPDAVMCQGEFVISYAVAEKLISNGIPVYVATTEREVSETKNDDGSISKNANFDFVGFRQYISITKKK